VANYAGTTETTIYVGGLLEKLTRGALTEFRHLIQAGQEHTVIYTRRSNGTTDTFHVTRDHLGSAAAITDAAGNVLIQESFTAFGARRGANWAGSPSSADWTQIANTTRRGFSDHEHLDNLNLIHMNGRVYDPSLGRFISADPFIDGWATTQGYNRYSYVHNNPLQSLDPSPTGRCRQPDSRRPGPGHATPPGGVRDRVAGMSGPRRCAVGGPGGDPSTALDGLGPFRPHRRSGAGRHRPADRHNELGGPRACGGPFRGPVGCRSVRPAG
jgi:RHS repeat-associated protein